MSTNLQETALNWLSRGVAPIPCVYQSKKPTIKWLEFQTRLPTEAEVKSWFSQQRNLGLICGWKNLVVLDFDDWPTYANWLSHHTEFETFTVLTARGLHLYYLTEQPATSRKLDRVDVKATGFVLTPPSIHPSGIPYVAVDPTIPIRTVDLWELLPPAPDSGSAYTEWETRTWRGNVDDLVSAIKDCCDIVSVFVDAKPSSRRGWFVTRCPFHEDHNPSFWIDAEKQICGCFAGCTEKPMDVIDLHARLRGITNRQAIRELGERIGWYDEIA